jgi:hypothetical protein
MLRFSTVIAASLFLLAGQAHAEILFRGALFVTATDGCTPFPQEGDFSNAQFHPSGAILAGNGNVTALNAIYSFSAVSYSLDSAPFTDAFQKVVTNGIGWTYYKPDRPSYVLVSKQTPATLDSNTKSVTLVGQIKNPFGITGQQGCVASFLFVGGKNVQ